MEYIILYILAACVIFGFFLHYRFLQTLKVKYPQVWLTLGSPSLFLNNSIKNNLSVLKFLNKKEYLGLNDPLFVKQCNFLRLFGRSYLILFIISVLYLIIFEMNPT